MECNRNSSGKSLNRTTNVKTLDATTTDITTIKYNVSEKKTQNAYVRQSLEQGPDKEQNEDNKTTGDEGRDKRDPAHALLDDGAGHGSSHGAVGEEAAEDVARALCVV